MTVVWWAWEVVICHFGRKMENSGDNVATVNKIPTCVLLFSGKRKSGKDYITDRLFDRYSFCYNMSHDFHRLFG
jgi:hypothetical protein